MGFQRLVNTSPAPGVVGDWASRNPRATFDAGPGGLVAGNGIQVDPSGGLSPNPSLAGVVVGRFAWATSSPADPDGGPTQVNNFGLGAPTGFVHREEQALITAYLADSTMIIPQGFGVVLMIAGDVWVKNEGTTQCLPGYQAVASFSNGAVSFQAPGGSAPATNSATSTVTAETFTASGFLLGNTLYVANVSAGTMYAGATISGTNIVSGTMLVANMGTQNIGGTNYTLWSVNIPEQSAGSQGSPITIAGTYGLLTLGGAPSNGNFIVGGVISGTGVVAGTQITALVSGSGGAGSTFVVNNNTTVGSTTITETLGYLTKWYAQSSALPGEIAKVSSWTIG
jgi:hypothetical protein